jgi:Domain of unknown function (DUF4105)
MSTLWRRIPGMFGLLVLALLVLVLGAWGALALWYFDDVAMRLRGGLAAAFALATLTTLIGMLAARWRRRALAAFLVAFAVVLACWRMLEPTNERKWQPEVAVLPYATIDGDQVTVHNIRNFDYRSETDFAVRYYDRSFDLRELDSVDLVAVYWMGPQIAHIFLSFGFAGHDYLGISIEARKPAGEGFSTIKGFFRQYELYYVVADERDVIRLRTNYRKDPPEEVHLYRLRGERADARRLFVSYLEKINSLKQRPEFYNSLTTNCTTNIWLQSRVNPDHLPFSWKILVSGHVPEYLYESGRLDSSVPFAELERRSLVNARAQAADQAADFSQRIRVPLPDSALEQ